MRRRHRGAAPETSTVLARCYPTIASHPRFAMSSIVRPTSPQRTRRLIVLICAVFAVLVPAVQSLAGLGQSQAEFSADGDSTLRIAGWAFSIWSLIYLWILAYAVWQVLPQTGESDLVNRMGWPSAVAFVLIGAWIIAAAADAKLATVVIIVAAMLSLVIPLLANAREVRLTPARDQDRWLLLWPLGLLAGWLTIASAANILIVATAQGVLPAALSPTGWAVLAVVVVVAVGVLGVWKLRLLAFPLPISWGLIGAFAAEQDRNPTLAFTALGAALLLLLVSVLLVFQLRRGIERTH